MIRLASYIRDSQGIDRRHVPPSQKPFGALVESNKAMTTKAKKVSTLRGPAQLENMQGALYGGVDKSP